MSEIPDGEVEVTAEELEVWRHDALYGLNPARADKRILTLIGEVRRLREELSHSLGRRVPHIEVDCP